MGALYDELLEFMRAAKERFSSEFLNISRNGNCYEKTLQREELHTHITPVHTSVSLIVFQITKSYFMPSNISRTFG
jgi:hypothetical protein